MKKSSSILLLILIISLVPSRIYADEYDWKRGWTGTSAGSFYTNSFSVGTSSPFKLGWGLVTSDSDWFLWVDIYKGSHPDTNEHIKAIYVDDSEYSKVDNYIFSANGLKPGYTFWCSINVGCTSGNIDWQVDFFERITASEEETTLTPEDIKILKIIGIVIGSVILTIIVITIPTKIIQKRRMDK